MHKDNYIIEMNHITKRFGGTLALDDASLFVKKGEIHALVGENGAGKSTMMRILAGASIPDQGIIQVHGSQVHFNSIRDALLKKGIGMVFQEGALIPTISVAENIFMLQEAVGTGARPVNWRAIVTKAKEILQELGVDLDVSLDAEEYSLEERCLVEVARNLVMNVQILILDELGATLTFTEMENVFRVLLQLKEKGCTVIFISHRLEEVMGFADRVTVFRKGKDVATLTKEEVTQDKLVSLMTGGIIDYSRRGKETVKGEPPVLSLNGLRIGETDINLHLYPGQIIGLAGVTGSGRSELLRTIFGLERRPGKFIVRGKETAIRTPLEAINHRIGYLPKERKLEGIISDESIIVNTTCMLINSLQKNLFLNKQQEIQITSECMERFSVVYGTLENNIEALSGGNQQKVLFSRLLCAGIEILLCDEPTRGVDIGARQFIHQQIIEHVRNGGAVIISSSELPELIKLCDQILVMRKGSVVAEFAGEKVNEEQIIAAMCSDQKTDRR